MACILDRAGTPDQQVRKPINHLARGGRRAMLRPVPFRPERPRLMSLSDKHPTTKRRRSQLLNHLLAYFIFAVIIVPVNFVTTPDTVWFFWPLVAWMAPLALHTAYAMGWFDRQ